jgi:hypothetical protein
MNIPINRNQYPLHPTQQDSNTEKIIKTLNNLYFF